MYIQGNIPPITVTLNTKLKHSQEQRKSGRSTDEVMD